MIRRIVVTGSSGLLGTHALALLHAQNKGLIFAGLNPCWDIVPVNHNDFLSPESLVDKLTGCELLLHFAGVNRGVESEVREGNPNIARALVLGLVDAGAQPHIVYANSVHSQSDTPYGLSKRKAASILANFSEQSGSAFSDVLLPHVFGEFGKPFYNSVTATLCAQVVAKQEPDIAHGATVQLRYAGDVAVEMLRLANNDFGGQYCLDGTHIEVAEIYNTLLGFRERYRANRFPDLTDPFKLKLFNTYRSYEFPELYPRVLKLNGDARGVLFEAVKGGNGGQTFMSWTEPGVERGNHFHLEKVERFVVVSGHADIRIRKLFDEKIHTFHVSGDLPVAVDIPTLHTHSIVNTGSERLLTLFWAHEEFNIEQPDTYAELVVQ